MKDRIKEIRKADGDSQEKCAQKLNLSRVFIAQVETGTNTLSDRSIKDFCRVYKVNEHWLRTGEGDPRPPKSRNQQIAEFMNDAMEDDGFINDLVYGLSQLDTEEWEVIARIMKKFASDNQKKEG